MDGLIIDSFNSEAVNNALVAYVHYLSFMLCFGALLFERVQLKPSPNRQQAISMIAADIVYWTVGPV